MDYSEPPINKYKNLRVVLKTQHNLEPSRVVKTRIMTSIGMQRQRVSNSGSSRFSNWLIGFGISIMVFSLMWLAVKPGLILGWSINHNLPAVFRVYRSSALDEARVLVREVQTESDDNSYQFKDIFLTLPVQYTYTIEVVGPNGKTVDSESLSVDTSIVLLTQLGIVSISLLLGWEFVMFLKMKKITFITTMSFN